MKFILKYYFKLISNIGKLNLNLGDVSILKSNSILTRVIEKSKEIPRIIIFNSRFQAVDSPPAKESECRALEVAAADNQVSYECLALWRTNLSPKANQFFWILLIIWHVKVQHRPIKVGSRGINRVQKIVPERFLWIYSYFYYETFPGSNWNFPQI